MARPCPFLLSGLAAILGGQRRGFRAFGSVGEPGPPRPNQQSTQASFVTAQAPRRAPWACFGGVMSRFRAASAAFAALAMILLGGGGCQFQHPTRPR